MRNIQHHSIQFLFFILLILSSNLRAFGQEANLTAIISQDVPNTEMTFKELKKIVSGQKRNWEDKSKVKLALMSPESEEGAAMAKSIFNASASSMNKYYLSMTFQGKIQAPLFFNSRQDLVDYINSNPGTIGIVPAEAADSCKKIKVDGSYVF